MEVLVKNQALERAFEEAMTAYCDRYPEAYDALLALIRQEEATLVRPSGFSAEGNFLTLGKMPEHLYSAIKQVFRKHLGIDDVWRDPENMYLFYKVCKSLKLKTHKTKRFRVTQIYKS